MIQRDSVHRSNAQPENKYDPRDLQPKALRQWERQERLWATIEENIRQRVPCGSRAAQWGGRRMERAACEARRRQESIALIENAQPSSLFTGIHTWESSLRVNKNDHAVRYIRLGTKSFPYSLYSRTTDNVRHDTEHAVNTRIILPGEKEWEKTDKNVLLPHDEAHCKLTVERQSDEYYMKQLRKRLPEVERRMSHFLIPRAYIEVCGKPPPWTTKREDMEAAERRTLPVVHVPPPGPPVSCSTSPTHSAHRDTRKNRVFTALEDSASYAVQSDNNAASDFADDEATVGPRIEISTTRILFVAEPGELAHGAVKIKNSGSTTVYYTWRYFQPLNALDRCDIVEEELAGGNHVQHERGDADSVSGQLEGINIVSETSGCPNVDESASHSNMFAEHDDGEESGNGSGDECVNSRLGSARAKVPLRSLASKSNESKTFFNLSSPLDGVILPDEEVVFPFSVRADYSGRFACHYELLTLPVLSSSVVVELVAIIRTKGPSLEAFAEPVEKAIDAKAVVETSRQVINALVVKESTYDMVEISKATEACMAASRAAEEARVAELDKWRIAWNDATYPALGISFNSDVYKRLRALYSNLASIMAATGQPLHHKEWDGSVQMLMANIGLLRDALSRNTLREATNVLIRAASVSESEDEPLEVLLRRVAGAMVLSTLAKRAGHLDDTIAHTLGIRQPNKPPTPRGNQHSSNQKLSAPQQRCVSPPYRSASRHNSRSKPGAPMHEPPSGRGLHAEEPTSNSDSILNIDMKIDPSVRQEFNARLFTGMRRLVGDAVEQLFAMLEGSRYTIEAACDLPLFDVTVHSRASEVCIIQNAAEMCVDTTVEIVQPKKKR
ncbi:hypothetical protein TRVL_01773 [Trypanosoma vivax]|nr:hypothetical protein TRVL_01773 [Trypanosoma vivax]